MFITLKILAENGTKLVWKKKTGIVYYSNKISNLFSHEKFIRDYFS